MYEDNGGASLPLVMHQPTDWPRVLFSQAASAAHRKEFSNLLSDPKVQPFKLRVLERPGNYDEVRRVELQQDSLAQLPSDYTTTENIRTPSAVHFDVMVSRRRQGGVILAGLSFSPVL